MCFQEEPDAILVAEEELPSDRTAAHVQISDRDDAPDEEPTLDIQQVCLYKYCSLLYCDSALGKLDPHSDVILPGKYVSQHISFI